MAQNLEEAAKLERMLRRTEAANYVTTIYGFPCSPKTLAKLACVSSDGPPFRLAGRFPLYPTRVWMPGRLPRLALGPVDITSPHLRLTPAKETRRHDSLAGSACAPGLQEAFNMHADSKTDGQIQGLPLFDWRAAVVHKPTTRAGQYLCRRLPIPPGHADLIVALAGLGSAVDR